MAKKTITGILSVLVMLAAGLSLGLFLHPLPPRGNPLPHLGLGQQLGQEALKARGPGGRIILITRDTVIFRNPAIEAQKSALVRTLAQAGTALAATNIITVDPLRLVAVPSGDFLQILRKASEADVIVSLLGPPVLTPAQLDKLGEKRPKVIAVCSGAMPRQVDLRRLFDHRLLHVAIISRPAPTPAPAPPATQPQPWFDHLFEVVTAANHASLPPNSPAPPPP